MAYIAKTARYNKINTFTAEQDFTANLIPTATNTYSLGSTGALWQGVYAGAIDVRGSSPLISLTTTSGSGTIVLTGSNTKAISFSGSGNNLIDFQSADGSHDIYITTATPTGSHACTLPAANSNPVQPIASATTSQWVQYIDSSGVQHLAQINYSDLAGSPPATPASFTISSKTTSFTASDGAGYYYRMSTNDMTVTLPASPADGSVRKFKMLTAGKTATFALNGAETINHATGESDQSLTLTYDQGVLELIAVSGGYDET